VSRDRPGDGIRAFVALEIDEEARRHLAELIGKLRGTLRGLRLVQPENLHLTLRFLGPASPEALQRLAPDLEQAAAACAACNAALGKPGFFPPRGRPRVLWLDVSLPPPVMELQHACERAAVAAGFPAETRPFRCHLTIGRFRDAERPGAPPELPPIELRLERLILFRSELRPQGPLYTALASFPLRGGGGRD